MDDWAFGLTDRGRCPKPALRAVQRAFADVPLAPTPKWPRISVIVCVYNGAKTIRDCCEGLVDLDYPSYEVIVVDDGSTDATAAIVSEYGFEIIRTPNRGLSNARNTGLEAATGEIVAFTDGDARPDPHWLTYLADTFMKSSHVGVGGWNIAPPDDGWIADCVASAPGGPVHVLLSDSVAEHIPGCCMAFRKSALEAIGGFDPQFVTAGDDVDVCWRLQERGWTLGFSHAAMVWHHNRSSIRVYWKQQLGYGRAEALLERKWPEKYNAAGHVTWGGRLYGKGLTLSLGRAGRIYQGMWGSAPFQQLVPRAPSFLQLLPLMPEWLLFIIATACLSLLGQEWPPLLASLPVLIAATVAPVAQAIVSASRADFSSASISSLRRLALKGIVAFLHILQPIARLCGRVRHGLTIWRQRGSTRLSLPIPRTYPLWVGHWQAPEERLRALSAAMKTSGAVALHGGEYDRWDLEARGGLFGSTRLQMAVEDSGSGTQVVRVRTWPVVRRHTWPFLGALLGLSVAAALDRAAGTSTVAAALSVLIVIRVIAECAMTTQVMRAAIESCGLLGSNAAVLALAAEQERS